MNDIYTERNEKTIVEHSQRWFDNLTILHLRLLLSPKLKKRT